jgi:glucose-6-phosphate 1-dehydrogenase
MDFCYKERGWDSIPEAYERLILDVLVGDSTLFTRWDEVQASWRIIDMLLNAWRANPNVPLVNYIAGSEGPQESFALLEGSGRSWKGLSEA